MVGLWREKVMWVWCVCDGLQAHTRIYMRLGDQLTARDTFERCFVNYFGIGVAIHGRRSFWQDDMISIPSKKSDLGDPQSAILWISSPLVEIRILERTEDSAFRSRCMCRMPDFDFHRS